MLLTAEGNGLIQGIQIARAASAVSHIMFADDILLLGRANERNASTMLQCLQKYNAWSRQLLNVQKSFVPLSSNTQPSLKQKLLHILAMPAIAMEATYLGNPLFLSRNRNKDF